MTRFDPNVDHPHHHLVCRQCGRVRDLVADFPDLADARRVPTSASKWDRPRSSSAGCAPSAGPTGAVAGGGQPRHQPDAPLSPSPLT